MSELQRFVIRKIHDKILRESEKNYKHFEKIGREKL